MASVLRDKVIPGKYFGFIPMAEIGIVKKLSLPKENPSNSICFKEFQNEQYTAYSMHDS